LARARRHPSRSSRSAQRTVSLARAFHPHSISVIDEGPKCVEALPRIRNFNKGSEIFWCYSEVVVRVSSEMRVEVDCREQISLLVQNSVIKESFERLETEPPRRQLSVQKWREAQFGVAASAASQSRQKRPGHVEPRICGGGDLWKIARPADPPTRRYVLVQKCFRGPVCRGLTKRATLQGHFAARVVARVREHGGADDLVRAVPRTEPGGFTAEVCGGRNMRTHVTPCKTHRGADAFGPCGGQMRSVLVGVDFRADGRDFPFFGHGMPSVSAIVLLRGLLVE